MPPIISREINRRGAIQLGVLSAGGLIFPQLASRDVRADGGAKPTEGGAKADQPARPFRVIGYLPDYRLAGFEETSADFVTDIIVFSAEPEASGKLNTRRLPAEQLNRLKQIKQRTRVGLLLCVGGWERSREFPAIAASTATRQRFVQEAIRFCLDQRFDGIDIDWEHPANATEQQNYALLLQDLKAGFQEHALSLSVTMAAWQQLPEAGFKAVDAVHIMAYDHQGQHSTLDGAKRDVQSLRDRNVPAEKLVLGLPFYGRGVTKPDRVLTYAEIQQKHAPTPDKDEVDGVYFNGPQTLTRKVEYTRQSGLQGVMIWELGQDVPRQHTLLRAIHQAALGTR